ncbi:MAG: BrnT family toxin [Bauldia sp.]
MKRYEWDLVKAAGNMIKHGISFEAVNGFDWERASVKEDRRRDYGESRFIAVGLIEGRLHVLVFAHRGDRIRVIGLRKANEREMLRYERS